MASQLATTSSIVGSGSVWTHPPVDAMKSREKRPRHDHVLEPVDDVEVAVVVLYADVSGVQPTAGERLGGGFGACARFRRRSYGGSQRE